MTEIERRLTQSEARALTDEIKADAHLLGTKLLRAYEGEAWTALDYESWRSYAVNELGISQSRAYQLLAQTRVIREISSAPVSTMVERPNERQARELAKVPEAQRAEVWRETVERTDGKPTAAAVRETYAPAAEPTPSRPPITDAEIAELRSLEDRAATQLEPDESDAPSEAELYASLDEAMEGTDARFRLNFGRAMKTLFTVLSFDRDRIVETADHKTLQGELDLLTEWADDLRRRMRPGLRIVSGDRE